MKVGDKVQVHYRRNIGTGQAEGEVLKVVAAEGGRPERLLVKFRGTKANGEEAAGDSELLVPEGTGAEEAPCWCAKGASKKKPAAPPK